MLREINDQLHFFICQTANWQAVVLAEDAMSAAVKSIEYVMKEHEKKGLAALVLVKQVSEDLSNEVLETEIFSTPIILADAGFHNESAKLKKFLEKQNE